MDVDGHTRCRLFELNSNWGANSKCLLLAVQPAQFLRRHSDCLYVSMPLLLLLLLLLLVAAKEKEGWWVDGRTR